MHWAVGNDEKGGTTSAGSGRMDKNKYTKPSRARAQLWIWKILIFRGVK